MLVQVFMYLGRTPTINALLDKANDEYQKPQHKFRCQSASSEVYDFSGNGCDIHIQMSRGGKTRGENMLSKAMLVASQMSGPQIYCVCLLVPLLITFLSIVQVFPCCFMKSRYLIRLIGGRNISEQHPDKVVDQTRCSGKFAAFELQTQLVASS